MTLKHTTLASNFFQVELGDVDFYFSYATVIAFRAPGMGLVVSENIWSSTTGKHLNTLSPKESRTKRAEFEGMLTKLMEKFGWVG